MKVALIGTANSGKTTLITELDKRKVFKNHSIINEVAGGFPIKERPKLSTQIKILTAQIEQESKYTNFISDRSVIDNTAYFMYHYKSSANRQKAKIHDEYMSKFNVHMLAKPYDAVVFVGEYFALEDNGIRDMDEDMQTWIYDALEGLSVIYCDVYGIPLYTIHGSIDDRIKMLKARLKPHYTQKRVTDYA